MKLITALTIDTGTANLEAYTGVKSINSQNSSFSGTSVLCPKALCSDSSHLNFANTEGSFNTLPMAAIQDVLSYEPRSEKTGLRGFRPGQHKPGCTATEDG